MKSELHADPNRDIEFIGQIIARSERRIDPQAIHFVVWGGLVMVWYPLLNYWQLQNKPQIISMVTGIALAVGILTSLIINAAMRRKPRLKAQNTHVSKQVGMMVSWFIGLGLIITAVGPWAEFISVHDIPTIWGLMYACMTFGIGVVYKKEFIGWAVLILAAAITAMFAKSYNGFILGPAMGLGLIIPGVRAEWRVRRLVVETDDQ